MDLFRYIVRFLYKIRWYLIILPLIALIVVISNIKFVMFV